MVERPDFIPPLTADMKIDIAKNRLPLHVREYLDEGERLNDQTLTPKEIENSKNRRLALNSGFLDTEKTAMVDFIEYRNNLLIDEATVKIRKAKKDFFYRPKP